jgi:hypothetical protein
MRHSLKIDPDASPNIVSAMSRSESLVAAGRASGRLQINLWKVAI